MYTSLQPFLQDTYSNSMVMKACLQYQQEPSVVWQCKIKFAIAAGVGILETVGYVAMAALSKVMSLISPDLELQYHQYADWSKGAGVSTYIGFLGVIRTVFATHLPKRIEDAANQECRDIIRNSSIELYDKIDKTRKRRIEEIQKNPMNPSDLRYHVWDKQSKELFHQMEQFKRQLDDYYPAIHTNKKYRTLQKAKKEVCLLSAKVEGFVITKFDNSYESYLDSQAEYYCKVVMIQLREQSHALLSAYAASPKQRQMTKESMEEILEETQMELDKKSQKFKSQKDKEKALAAFEQVMLACRKKRAEQLHKLVSEG
jgi:hypothetical protein